MKSTPQERPASLAVAEKVREESCPGHYDKGTKTWSNRNYDLTATKKHNEDM